MSDVALYEAWAELLGWMRRYAEEKGVRFVVEGNFPEAIYRLTKPYPWPTRIMSASLAYPENEERFFFAYVSEPHAADRHVGIRLMKDLKHLHLHLGEEGLELEGRPFTQLRFERLADLAREALRPV